MVAALPALVVPPVAILLTSPMLGVLAVGAWYMLLLVGTWRLAYRRGWEAPWLAVLRAQPQPPPPGARGAATAAPSGRTRTSAELEESSGLLAGVLSSGAVLVGLRLARGLCTRSWRAWRLQAPPHATLGPVCVRALRPFVELSPTLFGSVPLVLHLGSVALAAYHELRPALATEPERWAADRAFEAGLGLGLVAVSKLDGGVLFTLLGVCCVLWAVLRVVLKVLGHTFRALHSHSPRLALLVGGLVLLALARRLMRLNDLHGAHELARLLVRHATAGGGNGPATSAASNPWGAAGG